jgi:hypothetical protein
MVTGNRNFMQPMGRLSMHSKCLDLFSFKFWVVGRGGGDGGLFFIFPWFPMCFQCVPQHVLYSTSLLSHMIWQMLSSFHLYRGAKGEELSTSK